MKSKKNFPLYIGAIVVVLGLCGLVMMATGLATGLLVFVSQESPSSQPVAKVRLTRVKPPTAVAVSATATAVPAGSKPVATFTALPATPANQANPNPVVATDTPVQAQATTPPESAPATPQAVTNTPLPTQPASAQNVPPTFTPLASGKVVPTSTPLSNAPTLTPQPNITATTGLTATTTAPTATPTATSSKPTLTPTKTLTPKPGDTPVPTATSTLPIPTLTPIPTQTSTPAPTDTPAPTVGQVSGRVVVSGSPVEGIVLQLENQAYDQLAETRTNGNGIFTFAEVAPSNEGYNVVFKQGANSAFEKVAVSWGWIGPVAVQAGGTAQLPDFEIAMMDFKQTNPKDNAGFMAADISASSPIKFEWTNYPKATKYWVDLAFNDAQSVVWQSPLAEGTSVNFDGTLADGNHVGAGNYWWGVGIQQKTGNYSLVVYANLMLPLKIR